MDGREKLDMSDELVEKERPNSEHEESGGVGEVDGEGDGSLVHGGEAESLLSGPKNGL